MNFWSYHQPQQPPVAGIATIVRVDWWRRGAFPGAQSHLTSYEHLFAGYGRCQRNDMREGYAHINVQMSEFGN